VDRQVVPGGVGEEKESRPKKVVAAPRCSPASLDLRGARLTHQPTRERVDDEIKKGLRRCNYGGAQCGGVYGQSL